MTQQRSIIHLQLNEKHYYFGSLGALYSRFNKEELGVAYGTLRNRKIEIDKPFINDKCIIRKGYVITSSLTKEKSE